MKRIILWCVAVSLASLPLAPPAYAAGSTGTTGLAAGDFDGDGHDDLAVSAPLEDVGPQGSEVQDAGAVNVIYGGNNGLRPAGDQVWHQGTPGIADSPEGDDGFGHALAVGDFDGDGFDDLAVSVPNEEIATETFNDQSTGIVHIIFGSSQGLSSAGTEIWHQDRQGIQESAADFDQFGFAIAAGNLGKGRPDDLAVGVRGEDFGNPNLNAAGVVQILYGRKGGLTPRGDQVWHQDVAEVEGVAAPDEEFGSSLAIANFGRTGHGDLAVGVVGDTAGDMNALADAGAVNILYGAPGGLRADHDQRWSRDMDNVNGEAESDSSFGWALAAANFGRSRFADLAIGAPFDDLDSPLLIPNGGGVNVLYGGRRGLGTKGNQFWTQATPGIRTDPNDYSNFGNTLTGADFGRSHYADLGVGTPFADLCGNSCGLGHVFYGSRNGLKKKGEQVWTQDSPGVPDVGESGDFFGTSMAAGDFGRTRTRDLAIGVAAEDLDVDEAGSVNVLYGRERGLGSTGAQFWNQDSKGIKETAEVLDRFSGGQFD